MRYIATGCIAFTFSCIFYLLFSLLTIFPSFDEQMLINMLFISIGIMLLIFLVHLLPIQSPLISRMAELIMVITVLLIAGAYFDMFPFTSYYILTVVVTGGLTYAIVIIVLFMGGQAAAKKINFEIRKRRRLDESNN